jgi:uncharacterized protein
MAMNADDVARYLKANPGFFEQYADLLAQIYVPHPHGGRAIPLSDRQVLSLREKNRMVEGKLAELIQFGEENDALSAKVHRLSLALLGASELDATLSALYSSLREDFLVPHVAVRLWRGAGEQPEFAPVSAALRDHAAGLAHPFCGPNQGGFEAASWFAVGPEHIRSVALVPLGAGADSLGLLALASEDAKRFYPEMGTLYLDRIGGLAAAAIGRFV